ncbi:MAG: VOC family protein [Candidatus Heimdallarchaeota archaeon]|nr:VOC family protein [Candidatus Heimdallarchaeota archaeon]
MNPLRVNHIEIPVTDLDKAKEFFGSVFGWEKIMQPFSEDYILVYDDNEKTPTPSIGIYRSDKVTKNLVIVTIETQDIAALLKTIKNNGGKTTREKYEIAPEIGHAANFEDPFGNTWGIHSPPVKSD